MPSGPHLGGGAGGKPVNDVLSAVRIALPAQEQARGWRWAWARGGGGDGREGAVGRQAFAARRPQPPPAHVCCPGPGEQQAASPTHEFESHTFAPHVEWGERGGSCAGALVGQVARDTCGGEWLGAGQRTASANRHLLGVARKMEGAGLVWKWKEIHKTKSARNII